MSEWYLESSSAQTQIAHFSDMHNIEKMSQDIWYPRKCIEWSPNLQMALLDYFNNLKFPYRQYVNIPFEDPLRSEIRRFLISLDAYLDSPNPVIPAREILVGATSIGYAERLKRIKRKSFQTTWVVENFEYPDWWEEIPAYKIKDIGDIFNYSYLIFWKEPEPDDYLYGNIPVLIEDRSITKFKEYLSDILPDRNSFEKIEPIEILSQISSSMSLERGTFKHVPHYKLKPKNLFFSKKRGVSARSVIYVSPNNCRDSVLNDPSDLNTISMIDRQVMNILSKMDNHIHLEDKDEVTRRLRRLHHKYRFFLQRDLQKEGITKPRALLKAMLEVLHSAYPDIEIFEYTDFYDNFSLLVNDEILSMQRGHGLGMANALTTLMQLVIHEWITDELLTDIPSLDTSCLALNDDYTVAFNDEYHLESYWDKEDEVMRKLSLLREPTKSFRSELKFVLAERYFTPEGEYEKISYQLRELLLPLSCANVAHAKEYFIAAQTYVSSMLVPFYMEEVRAFWGYEFFPEEFNYPAKVGGWLNPKIGGIDLTLKMLEELPYNSFMYRGFKAAKHRVQCVRRGSFYPSPTYTLLGNPHIPKEYKDIINLSPWSVINDKYGRLLKTSQNSFKEYWELYAEERQKIFKQMICLPLNYLIEEIYNFYDTVQFYPPTMMISHYEPVDIIQTDIKDIYIDPNPIMAMVSKYNSTSYPLKEDFSIRFTNRDAFSKKFTDLYSKEIQRTLKSELLSLFFIGKYTEVMIPKDRSVRPELLYLEPVKIGYAVSHLDWGKGYPIIFEKYRHPLIEAKRSIFNRLFSIEEQAEIGRSGLNRACIKSLADYLNNNPQETVNSVLTYLKGFVVPKTNAAPPPEEEPEEEMSFELGEDWDIPPHNPEAQKITLEDLLSDQSYLFYSWRSSREDYYPADRITHYYLVHLDGIAIKLSHNLLLSKEEKLEIKESILNFSYQEDRILCLLAIHLGLQTLADDDQIDVFDSEEGALDIFGEDY